MTPKAPTKLFREISLQTNGAQHFEPIWLMIFCSSRVGFCNVFLWGGSTKRTRPLKFCFFFLNGSESYFRKDFLNSVTCHTDSPDMTTCEPCQATVFIGFLQYFVSWCKKDGA